MLGMASLTVGITGTSIIAKAEVSYSDREQGVREKALCHRGTPVL